MVWHPPKTWTPGEVVTAAELNEQVRDNLLHLSGEWTTYTPAWTNAGTPAPSVGNGSLVGRYLQTGRQVQLTIYLTIGSTTNLGSTGWRFGLPPGVAPAGGNWQAVGSGIVSQTGIQYGLITSWVTSTGGALVAVTSAGTRLGQNGPGTWAAGSTLSLQATLEAL